MVWIFTYKLKKKKSFLICRMINVCERESLGVGESCEKWELSELGGEKCIEEFIFETVEVDVKFIGARVSFKKIFIVLA